MTFEPIDVEAAVSGEVREEVRRSTVLSSQSGRGGVSGFDERRESEGERQRQRQRLIGKG